MGDTNWAHVRWFDEISLADIALVGGKNASLGELTRALVPLGIRVPVGFCVTAWGYRHFVEANRLQPSIEALLARLATAAALDEIGAAIRNVIRKSPFPADLVREIQEAYRALGQRLGESDPPVAVRSSATAEDLPGASFAGQHESFLNVRGEDQILDAVRNCYASLFTDRAMVYREAHGFNHMEVALSAGVQQLVAWPARAAGVVFTADPETAFPGLILVDASWGLGELVVKGEVNADEFVVCKASLSSAPLPILKRRLGAKQTMMVPPVGAVGPARTVETPVAERNRFALDDADVLELARWATAIEMHYGYPMDIEWAKDQQTGHLFIVQARAATGLLKDSGAALRTFTLSEQPIPVLQGVSVGDAIAAGVARLVSDPSRPGRFDAGDVLVSRTTSPDWVPLMNRAAAIVTDLGGRTSHAAIVSRELGVPAVVGTGAATTVLRDGAAVTVSCAQGSTGFVYDGRVPFREQALRLDDIPETRTRIMMNIAIPEAALRWWRLPVDGIGLARIEFIIANLVRAHPMALLHPERVESAEELQQVLALTRSYSNPGEFFVETLAQGIALIAASQFPRPVIVRTSDFKTNEYARLIGGRGFEPLEENPMIGWRGASRYYDEGYREAFALECEAIRRVREQMGLTNVVVMIPFCRTAEEADRVLAVMHEQGLERGRDNLEIYLMCEIPSNVVLAAEFAARFDGFSIGSNDLTQLVLGVDRDSAQLRRLFDEQNPAVKDMIRTVIRTAHDHGAKVGICGQAPSDHPEFAAFLVECGIDSISINPDSFVRVKRAVAAAEHP